MPAAGDNVRINTATGTTNSMVAKNGMNLQHPDRTGLDRMKFESLNQQDMQAKLQYFQSCDHQLLLQVLQNQMQSSNFGPIMENDKMQER